MAQSPAILSQRGTGTPSTALRKNGVGAVLTFPGCDSDDAPASAGPRSPPLESFDRLPFRLCL
jgi:hypothetical protein